MPAHAGGSRIGAAMAGRHHGGGYREKNGPVNPNRPYNRAAANGPPRQAGSWGMFGLTAQAVLKFFYFTQFQSEELCVRTCY